MNSRGLINTSRWVKTKFVKTYGEPRTEHACDIEHVHDRVIKLLVDLATLNQMGVILERSTLKY